MEQYYRAYHCILEMLADRGYTLQGGGSFSDLKKLGEEFQLMFQTDRMDLFGILTPEKQNVYVRFLKPDVPFKNQDDLKNLVPALHHFGVSAYDDIPKQNGHLIVIFTQKKTAKQQYEQNRLQTVVLKVPYVELFPVHTVWFNPTKHVLVPQHELLSTEDTKKILTLYDKKHLQKITSYDPINRWYGGKPGQIFRITRPDMAVAYRVVVKAVKKPIKK
ncbi:MAG: DNA-directed RNA polymerase subunit RpoH/Rpb5 C-terminal domain-containing protein [Sulfobacillus sp.]